MTDDIVTRLLEMIAYSIHPHQLNQAKLLSDAVKEIEHLRALIINIQKAILNEGRNPEYHQQLMRRHKEEWPVLWSAIDKLIKQEEPRGE